MPVRRATVRSMERSKDPMDKRTMESLHEVVLSVPNLNGLEVAPGVWETGNAAGYILVTNTTEMDVELHTGDSVAAVFQGHVQHRACRSYGSGTRKYCDGKNRTELRTSGVHSPVRTVVLKTLNVTRRCGRTVLDGLRRAQRRLRLRLRLPSLPHTTQGALVELSSSSCVRAPLVGRVLPTYITLHLITHHLLTSRGHPRIGWQVRASLLTSHYIT